MSENANVRPERHVVLVGAGIVGACTALYLQREGFRVTLIDRGPPGEGASAGNAGSLGVASIPPASMPGLLKKLPRMMRDPMTPLALRWSYLPFVAPWLLRFLANGARAKVERIADSRSALLSRLLEAYEPLLAAAGARELVRHEGKLHVYESADGTRRSAYALDLRRRRGVRFQELTGDQAREIEPALGPVVKAAVFFPDVRTVVHPLGLVRALVQQCVRQGGRVVRETVRDFEIGPEGVRAVVTDAGRHAADHVVICAGAWSAPLAARLGTRVPLEAEWGYHAMIPAPGVELKTSITSNERYVVLTRMQEGMRISGIAQFAGIRAAPDYRLVDRLLANARAVVPALRPDAAVRWAGPRPSVPDSTPVIGRAPRHGNVVFAFGHDHIGLATAAITGRLVAELMAGKPPSVDLAPYRPDRF